MLKSEYDTEVQITPPRRKAISKSKVEPETLIHAGADQDLVLV
jgi:hypothetical protein